MATKLRELKVPGEGHKTPQSNQRDCSHEPHPRLALAIVLNHLWLREVECLLILSSDDSLDETRSISTANTTEHLESIESIRNQSGFPLSSAEICMTIQLRARGGGPGIRAQMSRLTAKSGHLLRAHKTTMKQLRAQVLGSGCLGLENWSKFQLCRLPSNREAI